MIIDFVTRRKLNQLEAVVDIVGFNDPDLRYDIIKYDFATVDGLVAPELAIQMQMVVVASGGKLEILDWEDPILAETPRDECRVIIDGVMPLDAAFRLQALGKEYNTKLTQH
jgi:hypothetical protein